MLLEHGTSAFPHYATILADKTSSHEEIDGVLTVLLLLKVSKGQFYSLVVPFLSHEDDGIRCGAVGLMNEIGTREEGPILIALLSDKYGGVRHAAAEALAAHGGQRELAAMDVWLQSGTALRDKKPYLKHVKECRDMLEQRLKEAEKKEKEKEKK